MRYEVIHTTVYDYSTPAALSLNEVCLTPRSMPFQRVARHTFHTEPKDDYHRDRTDFFGNHWRLYAFEKPHRRLEITSRQTVEVDRSSAPGDGTVGGWEPFLHPSPFVRWNPGFVDYGRRSFVPGRDRLEAVVELTRRIFDDFYYDAKATKIGTPVEEFFEKRRGVCQDFSHLMIAVLRSQGVPARYVSGYLNTVPPPGKEKIFGADASHAWVSAFTPHHGWVDLDPTNGLVVANGHVTLAWGRDYGDVAPLKGVVLGGGTQKLKVEVTVLGQA